MAVQRAELSGSVVGVAPPPAGNGYGVDLDDVLAPTFVDFNLGPGTASSPARNRNPDWDRFGTMGALGGGSAGFVVGSLAGLFLTGLRSAPSAIGFLSFTALGIGLGAWGGSALGHARAGHEYLDIPTLPTTPMIVRDPASLVEPLTRYADSATALPSDGNGLARHIVGTADGHTWGVHWGSSGVTFATLGEAMQHATEDVTNATMIPMVSMGPEQVVFRVADGTYGVAFLADEGATVSTLDQTYEDSVVAIVRRNKVFLRPQTD